MPPHLFFFFSKKEKEKEKHATPFIIIIIIILSHAITFMGQVIEGEQINKFPFGSSTIS
jgi:hypothetical protein